MRTSLYLKTYGFQSFPLTAPRGKPTGKLASYNLAEAYNRLGYYKETISAYYKVYPALFKKDPGFLIEAREQLAKIQKPKSEAKLLQNLALFKRKIGEKEPVKIGETSLCNQRRNSF